MNEGKKRAEALDPGPTEGGNCSFLLDSVLQYEGDFQVHLIAGDVAVLDLAAGKGASCSSKNVKKYLLTSVWRDSKIALSCS